MDMEGESKCVRNIALNAIEKPQVKSVVFAAMICAQCALSVAVDFALRNTHKIRSMPMRTKFTLQPMRKNGSKDYDRVKPETNFNR